MHSISEEVARQRFALGSDQCISTNERGRGTIYMRVAKLFPQKRHLRTAFRSSCTSQPGLCSARRSSVKTGSSAVPLVVALTPVVTSLTPSGRYRDRAAGREAFRAQPRQVRTMVSARMNDVIEQRADVAKGCISPRRYTSKVINASHQRCPFEHTAEAVSARGISTLQAGHFSSRPSFVPQAKGKDEVTFSANISASTDNSWGVPGGLHRTTTLNTNNRSPPRYDGWDTAREDAEHLAAYPRGDAPHNQSVEQ